MLSFAEKSKEKNLHVSIIHPHRISKTWNETNNETTKNNDNASVTYIIVLVFEHTYLMYCLYKPLSIKAVGN